MIFLKHPINFLLIIALLGVVVFRNITTIETVQPDSNRYIAMGLNLAEYNTLSGDPYSPAHSPNPGIGWGGTAIAYEIALAATLHEPTKRNLICIANAAKHGQNAFRTACHVYIPSLKIIHIIEFFIFHLAVLCVAQLIFDNRFKAWSSVGISLCFQETSLYVDQLLTEPSYMMFAGIFLTAWAFAWKNPQSHKSWFFCGFALGCVVLTKPAWNALLPSLFILLAAYVLWNRHLLAWATRSVFALALGLIVVVAPIVLRNIVQLNVWSLSDPAYLAASLAHRMAFNAMTWKEWAMGWLYYMPRSGAIRLFGIEALNPIGLGPDSYFSYGYNVLTGKAHALGGDDQGAIRYILKNHFFNDPVKGIAVTALLTWKGVFVGHVLGMFAVMFTGLFPFFSRGDTRRSILILILPLIIMAAVNALASISMSRYNMALILPYSLILVHFFYLFCTCVMSKMPKVFINKVKTFFDE